MKYIVESKYCNNNNKIRSASNIIICININLRLSLQTYTPSTDQLNMCSLRQLCPTQANEQWLLHVFKKYKQTIHEMHALSYHFVR